MVARSIEKVFLQNWEDKFIICCNCATVYWKIFAVNR
jgi:hypothetical protein